jgi:hypothetical protein
MLNDFSLFREPQRELEFLKAYRQLVEMHALDRETGIPAEVLVDHARSALMALRTSVDTIDKTRINQSLDDARKTSICAAPFPTRSTLAGCDTRRSVTEISELPGQPAHFPKRGLGSISAKIQEAMDQSTPGDTRPLLDNKSAYDDDGTRYGLEKGGAHATD